MSEPPKKIAKELLDKSQEALAAFDIKADVSQSALIYSFLAAIIGILGSKTPPDMYPQILSEYKGLLKEIRAKKVVTVEASVPLTEEEKSRLRQGLGNFVGSDFSLEVKVNPEIIGGLVVRTQDKVLDLSLERRLDYLKERLVA